jgi:hypothetical protein
MHLRQPSLDPGDYDITDIKTRNPSTSVRYEVTKSRSAYWSSVAVQIAPVIGDGDRVFILHFVEHKKPSSLFFHYENGK